MHVCISMCALFDVLLDAWDAVRFIWAIISAWHLSSLPWTITQSDPAARSLFPVKLYLHLPQPISRHCPFLWFFLYPSLSKGNNLLFVCQSQRWMEWHEVRYRTDERKEGRRDGTEGLLTDDPCGVTNGRRDQKIIWTEDKASNLKAINNNQ